MYNISVSCAEIQSSVGFVYMILPVILNQTLNDPDCEQSWYTEDGRLIADPSNPHKLMYPVTSVSSDRLVTSDCVNLIHEIICDESRLRMETMFRVFNDTDSSGGSAKTPNSHQFWWILALCFITVVVLLLLICFMLCNRIFSRQLSQSCKPVGTYAVDSGNPLLLVDVPPAERPYQGL